MSDMDNGQGNTGVTEENGNNETQESGKTFTQEELDRIVTQRIAREQKRFEGIDVDEYRTLKEQAEKAENDRLMKREEFDKVLKSTKEKYDGDVNQLRSELEKVKLDGTLKSVASKLKTTNPEHVAQLLRSNVKLDESGQPVVVDQDGNVRYNTDTAEQFTIEDLVNEFVASNPYFKTPGKSGTGGSGNTENSSAVEFDINTLDLTKKADREKYAELKAQGKVRSF